MKNYVSCKCCKYIFVLLLVFIATSVSAKEDLEGFVEDWQAPYFKNHELVGKIWDTHKDAFISAWQMRKELLHYDYILLGETHNNDDHHRLQAIVIDMLVQQGVQPTVVMEMLTLQSWQDQPPQWNDLTTLQMQASQLNKGWPWELYTPLLDVIVQHQLNLYAANISRDELQRWTALHSEKNQQEVLNEYAFTQENYKTLSKNIVASHCGYGGEEYVRSMSRAQMQRDRIMTESILNKSLPVVFIAGSGHVRNDYAVPMQLRRKFKQTSYLSVAFISVSKNVVDPPAYLQNGKTIYDMLVFTPNHTNQDPCEEFRKQLKNMHHRQTP